MSNPATAEEVRDIVREEIAANATVRNPSFTDTSGAAAYCNTTPAMFITMRRERRGPPYHKVTHRMLRYRYDELDAWMASYKIDHEADFRERSDQ